MSNKTEKQASWFYRLGKLLIIPVFKLFYFVKIKNKENFPSGKCIVCANHSAFKDPMLLALIQKRQIYFMAKSEFFKSKFLAKVFSALGAFSVERGTGAKDAISHAEMLLENGKILGIFIEGKRSKDAKLLHPKNGAAMLAYNTNTPIVPVALSRKDGKPMKIFHKITVNVGKPLYPDKDLQFTDGTAKEIRNASRIVMDNIRMLRNEDILPEFQEA